MLDPVSIPFLLCVALQVARAINRDPNAPAGSQASAGDDALNTAIGFGAGVAGNFTHEMAKTAWARVNERLSRGTTPANHDIMRAVRRAVLRGALSFSQQWRLELKREGAPDSEWHRNLDVWLHAELDRVDAADYELPQMAGTNEVELLFRPRHADAKAMADLQSRLTENFLKELKEHTRTGRIQVADRELNDPRVPARFEELLLKGCLFAPPGPGLLKKAKELLQRDVTKLFDSPAASPPSGPPVSFFAAVCEYFVEDFKSNQRLHAIIDAQLLLDLKYPDKPTPATEMHQLKHELPKLLDSVLRGFAGPLDASLKRLEEQARVIEAAVRTVSTTNEEQFRRVHETLEEWAPYLKLLPAIQDRFSKLQTWLEGFRHENRQLHGETHRLLHQLFHQLTHGIPAVITNHPPLSVVPPRPLCFGRQGVVEDLARQVLKCSSDHQPVVISGTGGLGKTNLVINLLHHPWMVARFADRRLFVECQGCKSLETLLAKLADAFGLRPDSPTLRAEIRNALREAPMLLAFDNAETPLDSEPVRVREFLKELEGEPHVTLVVNRRGRAEIGLNRPVYFRDLRKLDEAAARQLFLERANGHLMTGNGVPEIDYSKDAQLHELLKELDGHPLSIQLVAAYAATGREPKLAAVLSRWKAHDLSMAQQGGDDDKDQNLSASFALSFDRLKPSARRLARMLALLPAGMARGDVSVLLPLVREDPAGDLIRAELVELSGVGNDRLTMLAPLRECALASQLRPDENPKDKEEDRERVLTHYLNPFAPLKNVLVKHDWPALLRRVEPELGNVEALFDLVFEKTVTTEQDALWDVVVAGYGWFAYVRTASVRPLEAAAVSSERHCRKAEWARRLFLIGRGLSMRDVLRSRELYEKALPLFEAASDRLGQANCIRSLGALLQVNDLERARELYEKALLLYEAEGSRLGQANCIQSLGDLLYLKDPDKARELYEKALLLYEAMGSSLGQANCIRRLGLLIRTKDPKRAREFYEKALPLYEAEGDRLGKANCLQGLGDLLQSEDPVQARQLYEMALTMIEAVGSRSGQANCIRGLGDLLAGKDSESAQAQYEKSLVLFESVGDRMGQAECIQGLGGLLQVKDPEGARRLYEKAMALYEAVGYADGQAKCKKSLDELPPDEPS